MKRQGFAFFILFLFVSIVFVRTWNVSAVKGSFSIHQGDLVLNGNNVTVIEGRFDINGSIIVEENATLILRNSLVNFTQSESYQFNMTFQNPVNGNPSLTVENATIASSNYNQRMLFYGNSTASVNNLTSSKARLETFGYSVASISNSEIWGVNLYYYSAVNMSNSSAHLVHACSDLDIFNCTLDILNLAFAANSESEVLVSDSTVDSYVMLYAKSANCSIAGLEPCSTSHWNFEENCSVKVAPGGYTPNVTLTNTQVEGWGFAFEGSSNATTSNSKLSLVYGYDYTTVIIHNTSFTISIGAFDDSEINAYDSTTSMTYSNDDSKIRLVNSTSNTFLINHQSNVYVNWHLGVHVIDSVGQDVPSAFVRTSYLSEPGLIIVSGFTDTQGLVRLTLLEKMMNATGEYPVGNYTVEATYDIYSDDAKINMTENKQITLTLEDFIIPEFPSFLIQPLFMIATLLVVIIYGRKQMSGFVES